MTDNEDQARRKDDARPNEQLQWGKHDALHAGYRKASPAAPAVPAPDAPSDDDELFAAKFYSSARPAPDVGGLVPTAHPADAGAVAVEQANDMRIALVVQLNELIDLGDRYARRMRQADPDESAYAQGAIDYARRVMAAHNYNGPLRAPCLASQPQATPLEATSEQLEAVLIEQRIAITPEYEGGFVAEQFGDDETASAKGYGATPSEAIAAMQPVEGATSEQMGGAQVAIPDALFDGCAVYQEVMANDPHTPRVNADQIADVLDAVVRLIRRAAPTAERAAEEEATSEQATPVNGDAIAKCKHILYLVDEYELRRTAQSRTDLRMALMAEFEAASERKPLTEPEIKLLARDTFVYEDHDAVKFVRAIEQHHGIGGGK